MTRHMFQMAPGEVEHYRVRPIGAPAREELLLEVHRPREGLAVMFELVLRSELGAELARGRVPIDRGYLEVVLEVRRQIGACEVWKGLLEFDLQHIPCGRGDEFGASGGAEAGA